jgi:hypothetical protein
MDSHIRVAAFDDCHLRPAACEIGKDTIERRRQLLSQHRLRKRAVAMHRTDEQMGSAEAEAAYYAALEEPAALAA